MEKYFKLIGSAAVCIYFWYCAHTYTQWHFIDGADLIFHEAGHTIFSFFGTFIHVLAGSGFQILLPLCIALYFFYQKQYISGSLCLLWVGQNFLNVSVYAGDAIRMELDLLGGDSVIHDWNYLLESTGLLSYAPRIASIFHSLGILFIITGTTLSLYYSWIAGERNTNKQFTL